jgi:hypothetical protein
VSASLSRGVPYPTLSDGNDIQTAVQPLAEWVNDRPGISPLSSAARDGLGGAALWDGRVIYNLTTQMLEAYSAADAAWYPAGPRGQVARATIAANVTSITAATILMTATPTVRAGRRYKVSSQVQLGGSVANMEGTHQINRDGTPVSGSAAGVTLTYGTGTSFYLSTRVYTFTAPVTGDLIFQTVAARRVNTGGSLTAAALDSLLLVEDLGVA